MTFLEIANRVTGFSIPIFGISWNPPKLEKQLAERVIIYLEDRRVIYDPYELEVPKHCVESILKIRAFLTEQLYDTDSGSALSNILRAMRDACRRFLEMLTINDLNVDNWHRSGLGAQMLFYSGIGELRAVFGSLIARLLVMHGIDCESNLVRILPLQYLDN